MGLPYQLGNSGPEITYFQQWFGRAFKSYAPPVTGRYDDATVASVKHMQGNLGLLPTGMFDIVTAEETGYKLPNGSSPNARHLAVVFRGTGGIIGQDYVSLICQPNADLVEEINPPWAATMGGLPVGTAGNISDPSMSQGVINALNATKPIVAQALHANPKRKVIVGGYSAGAVVAAYVRQYVQSTYPNNYLCSFSLGDPSRPAGGCYYPFGGGIDPGGEAIGSWHYGDITDPRHCWLANHTDSACPDMYTIVPKGVVWQIMSAAYDGITKFSFSDFLSGMMALVEMIPTIAGDMGISLPAVLQSMSGGLGGLLGGGAVAPTASSASGLGGLLGGAGAGLLGSGSLLGGAGLLGGILGGGNAAPGGALNLPGMFLGGIEGLIGVGNPESFTGIEAGTYAARLGLTFMAAGTRPHISYHVDEVWPGQTYLGLGIQHVRYYASQTPPQ